LRANLSQKRAIVWGGWGSIIFDPCWVGSNFCCLGWVGSGQPSLAWVWKIFPLISQIFQFFAKSTWIKALFTAGQKYA